MTRTPPPHRLRSAILLGTATVFFLTIIGAATLAAGPVQSGPRTTLLLDGAGSAPNWALENPGDDTWELVLTTTRLHLQEFVVDGQSWQRLDIQGAFEVGDVGRPALPMHGRLVRIPAGMTLEAKVLAAEPSRLPGLQIFPVQAPQPEGFSLQLSSYEESRALAGLLPEVRVGEPAIMAGATVVPLTVEAAAYDPAGKEVVVWKSIRLELRFVPHEQATPGRTPSPLPPSFATTVLDASGQEGGAGTYGTYIAVHSGVAGVQAGIEPLLDWRKRQGYHVVEINTQTTGGNNNAIKDAIAAVYDDPTLPPLEFVTIFGDASGTYTVPAWNETLSGYGGDGDHYYAMLEGDDILADVHIGRVSFSNPTEMATVINKILNYETAPPMDDTEWFGRACLQGDPSASGITTITTNQWLKGQLQAHGWSHVDTTWSGNFPVEMVGSVNQGVSAYGYRGYLGTSGISNGTVSSLTNGGRLAVALLPTCGSGSFAGSTARSEAWLRAPNGGAVAAIGTATTGTHTRYNNCYYLGAWDGLLNRGDARIGVAHTLGKVAVFNGYHLAEPNNAEIWAVWNNIMGDAATAIWLGVPASLTVDHAPEVASGGQALPVTVSADGAPVAGAIVTVYRADPLMGEDIQVTGHTDAAGNLVLDLPAMEDGSLHLTVTAQGFLPHQGGITAGQPDVFCGLSSFSTGNDFFPGATLDLVPSLRNQGTTDAFGVTAEVSVLSGPATLTGGSLIFGTIAAGNEVAATTPLGLHLDPSARNAETIRLLITAGDGSAIWTSMLEATVAAPELLVEAVGLSSFGGSLDPGESGALGLVLHNAGLRDAETVRATISSPSPWLTIVDGESSFGNIAQGESAQDLLSPFRVSVSPDCFGGHLAVFYLDIVYADGALASEAFALTVGNAASDQPTGPDAHGYYAFDNTDLDSGLAPTYDWVGIDPDHGAQGQDLGLTDFGWEQDDTRTIDLPFTFRFYGEDYDQASICSNGWMAMGETPVVFYRNFPLPAPHSAGALISPFWDNLYQSGINKVYTWHDTENHRFVVQWYGMRNTYTNAAQNFELILLDPAHNPTATGDGMIIFQYEQVSDTDSRDGYATIGIQNMARDVGLNYAYWNQYAAGASQAVGGRAILFAPYGPPALPQMAVSPGFLEATVLPGGQETLGVQIANQGEEGSLLEFSIEVRDPLLMVGAKSGGQDDPQVEGRNLTGSFLHTSTSEYESGTTIDLPLTVSCVSDDDEWLMKVEMDLPTGVTVNSATGLAGPNSELGWNMESGDGVVTSWGDGTVGPGGFIYPGQTANGSINLSISPGFTGELVIPWNLSGDQYGNPPHEISGEVVLLPTLPTIQVTAPASGDVFTLGDPLEVVFSAVNGPTIVNIDIQREADGPWQNLVFAWPADQSPWTWTVTGAPGPYTRFRVRDNNDASVVGVSGVFGISRDMGWVQPQTLVGDVGDGQVLDIPVTLDAAGLAVGIHEALLIVSGNGGAPVPVPITLTVSDTSPAGDTPLVTRLLGNHPDPFNPSTTIRFALAGEDRVRLDIYDLRGQRVATPVEGHLAAGQHSVVWNGTDRRGAPVASGVYFYRLETSKGSFNGKMVLAK